MKTGRISTRIAVFSALIAWLILSHGCIVCAETGSAYYVAPDGSDTNDGSIEYPWATIAYAASNTGPGDTVYLRGGTYEGKVTFRGDWGHGGTEDNWWTFTSYPGEEAVIDGDILLYSMTYTRISGLHLIDHRIELGRWTAAGFPVSHHVEILDNLITGAQPDYGGITVVGNDILIKDNTIIIDDGGGGLDHGIYLSEGDNNVVDGNYVSGAAGFGIHLFVKTFTGMPPHFIRNAVVRNNIVTNSRTYSGYTASSSQDSGIDGVIFKNNISYNNAGGALNLTHVGAYLKNIKAFNNTFADEPTGIRIGVSWKDNTGIMDIEVTNNIIEATEGDHLYVGDRVSGVTESNNIYWPKPLRLRGIQKDASSIVCDAMFINEADDDFHLKEGSPAIDAGSAIEGVDTDHDGNPRPMDGDNDGTADYDIGAYEHSELKRINPLTDLEYLGAFRLPSGGSGAERWSHGGYGMTYCPTGDPGGEGDGYPGSLFGVGHVDHGYVSECSIPAPVISAEKNLTDLPRAVTLQPFIDVTNGVMQEDERQLTDIQYYSKQGGQTTDKLYWALYDFYVPDKPKLHGWCELDFSNLQSQGTWQLKIPSLTNTAAQTAYLFDILPDWAEVHVPGDPVQGTTAKYLATGRKRPGQGQGSFGPALYAYAPWNHGNPPADDAKLDTVQLLYYDPSHPSDEEHAWNDRWRDGAWLSVGGKQAVIFAGLRPMRNFKNGLEYYGPELPGHIASGKGYHSDPTYAAILFYDTDDLALVAQGDKESYEPHPYAVFNVTKYLYPAEHNANPEANGLSLEGFRGLGGVGYDRDRQLLYVMQRGIDGFYERAPIVHVFRVSDNGGSFDTAPPRDPKNLRVVSKSSNSVELAWDAAIDNTGVSGYVVYKNFVFIAITDRLSFSDISMPPDITPIISPNTTYKYSVAAFDCANNYGPQCAPVEVTTDDGADEAVPLLTKASITDITPTSATLSWKTDEPSITKIEYSIIYGGEEPVIIEDRTLTLTHYVTLTDLTPNSRYGYTLTAEDAFGNIYRWADSLAKFYTAKDAPPNDPELDDIGPQEIYEGEELELTITGSAAEGRRYSFSASDIPECAMFNREIYGSNPFKAWFGWTPRFDQAGTYEVTFTINDGTASDSETVTITVLDVTTPGDVDGDGDVDIFDLYAVSSAFGTAEGDAGYSPSCDFDNDGDVDINDLYECGSNFGAGV